MKYFLILLLASTGIVFAQDTPIANGKLQTDLNANGHQITNLPTGTGAGSIVTTDGTQTLTNKTITSGTLGSDLSAAGKKIINLGAPTNSGDASPKNYVDAASDSLLPTREGLINWRAWRTAPYASGGIIISGNTYDVNAAVEPSAFVDTDGKIYVYYAGLSNTNTWSICLATGYSFTSLTKQGTVLSKGTGGDFDAGYVSGPRIKKFGSTYYLYYFGAATGTNASVGYEDEPASISVATAPSPAGPWTKTGVQLITTGTAGGWDDVTIYRPDVIEKNGIYHLFFNAKSDAAGIEDIGVATGTSPLGPFTKYAGNPVVTHGESWAALRNNDPYIVPVRGGYMMFYSGNTDFGANPPNIGAAFSADLLSWTEYAGNPLPVRAPGGLNGGWGWRPDVHRVGSEWVMLYDVNSSISIATAQPMGLSSVDIGLQNGADSNADIRWSPNSTTTPLIYAGIVSGTTPSLKTIFNGRRTRGSPSSPAAVASTDHTVQLLGSGYDGTTLRDTAGIRAEVFGTVASGTVPQRLVFSTGTAGSAVDRMWIQPDGKVGIATSSTDATVEVNTGTGGKVRLSYNDADGSAANYVDIAVSSAGAVTITPSGSSTTITGTTVLSAVTATNATFTNINITGSTYGGTVYVLKLASDLQATGTANVYSTESVTLPAGNYQVFAQTVGYINSGSAGMVFNVTGTSGSYTYNGFKSIYSANSYGAENLTGPDPRRNPYSNIANFSQPFSVKTALVTDTGYLVAANTVIVKMTIQQRDAADGVNPAILSNASFAIFRKLP